MKTEQLALIAACLDNPYDAAYVMVYADWCIENDLLAACDLDRFLVECDFHTMLVVAFNTYYFSGLYTYLPQAYMAAKEQFKEYLSSPSMCMDDRIPF